MTEKVWEKILVLTIEFNFQMQQIVNKENIEHFLYSFYNNRSFKALVLNLILIKLPIYYLWVMWVGLGSG